MALQNMKIPEAPKMTDTIHPDYSDEEYTNNFWGHLPETKYGLNVYNKLNEEYADSMIKAEALFQTLEPQALEAKIEMLKSALQYVNNSIQAQKFGRKDKAQIDDTLLYTCMNKKLILDEIDLAEKELIKNRQNINNDENEEDIENTEYSILEYEICYRNYLTKYLKHLIYSNIQN